MAALTLIGCAQQRSVVNPADAAAQLATGAPLLRCRDDCLADWRRAQPQAAQLAAAARWSELAALVIGIGYQDDLTLYYLARAAEWLGYPEAAASYYRQSTYISGTSLSCYYQSGVCGGVALPDAALSRIEAIEEENRPSRRRFPRRPSTGARQAPIESKPQPASEPPQPAVPVPPQPGPSQPAIPVPPHPTAPEPQQPAVLDPRQPAADPVPPAPPRVDPTAKEYIEPPAAR